MDSVILYAYRFKYRQCISTSDSHFPGSKTLEPVPTSDSSENVNTWKHKTNSLQHKRRNKVFLTSALASGFETSEAELEQRERTHRHKARVKNIRPPFWDAGILGETGTISRVGRKSATKVMQFSSTGWIISSRRVSRPDWLSLGLRGWMQDAQMQLYWELKKKAFFSQACMAWHYQICIAKFQYSTRDDLPGTWGKNTAQECKSPFLVDGRRLKKVGTVARTLSCWFRWTSVTTGCPSSLYELPRVSILFCILRTIYRLWGLCMKNLI